MPHTKQYIQQLLDATGMSPHHKWGQNFLIDLNLMRLLVGQADLKGHETILEVGHGTGSLTELLCEEAGWVVAVDIDPNMSQIAQQELAEKKNVTFYQTDILKKKSCIVPEVLEAVMQKQKELNGPFYLIANLPYNIASPLMINLLLGETVPDGMFVTIQTEVAQRIIATPATKAYGQLSILLQATGQTQLIRTLGPQAFWPPPKVTSAMVSWVRSDEKWREIQNVHHLKHAAETLFGHRRKKISTCMKDIPDKHVIIEQMRSAGIDPNDRGENLTVAQYVWLGNHWK